MERVPADPQPKFLYAYLLSIVVVSVVHKTKSSWAAPLILHHSHTQCPPWGIRNKIICGRLYTLKKSHRQKKINKSTTTTSPDLTSPAALYISGIFFFLTKCREDFLEFVISVVFAKVLDVDIGELHGFGAKLHFSFFAGLEVADETANGHKPTTDRTAAEGGATSWIRWTTSTQRQRDTSTARHIFQRTTTTARGRWTHSTFKQMRCSRSTLTGTLT